MELFIILSLIGFIIGLLIYLIKNHGATKRYN